MRTITWIITQLPFIFSAQAQSVINMFKRNKQSRWKSDMIPYNKQRFIPFKKSKKIIGIKILEWKRSKKMLYNKKKKIFSVGKDHIGKNSFFIYQLEFQVSQKFVKTSSGKSPIWENNISLLRTELLLDMNRGWIKRNINSKWWWI